MKFSSLKKICCATAATVILGSSFAFNALSAGAAYINSYTTTWETGTFNKTYHKEQFQQIDTLYVGTLRYCSTSLYWDGGRYASQNSISIAQGVTTSSTTSLSLSTSFGFQIAPEGVGVKSDYGVTSTNSVTTSYSDTQTYCQWVDRSSPAGYYTWESRINFWKWKTDTWKKNTKNASWTYLGYGYATTMQTKNPYYYCAYTNHAVN